MSISALVDRGLLLRAQMREMEDELDIIEAQLRQAALSGEQVPLVDPEREGRQWLARGSEAMVPVVLTADLVTASFSAGSVMHGKLAEIAEDRLEMLYRPTTVFKMVPKGGKAFRQEAAALLGAKAPAFVDAALSRDKKGVPKSAIKVEWDRYEGVLS